MKFKIIIIRSISLTKPNASKMSNQPVSSNFTLRTSSVQEKTSSQIENVMKPLRSSSAPETLVSLQNVEANVSANVNDNVNTAFVNVIINKPPPGLEGLNVIKNVSLTDKNLRCASNMPASN